MVTSEARKIINCVPRGCGFEAWRNLTLRYEPQSSIRRMKEIAELTSLQNKRCKNAAETSLIVLEVDRRKRLIEDIGGQVPSNDILVSVLWCAMGPNTRSHVSVKLDVETVEYPLLRQAVNAHTSLVGATSSRTPTAMDIGPIANVMDSEEPKEEFPTHKAHTVWSLDGAEWPAEDEGWPGEGYYDEHSLNFV